MKLELVVMLVCPCPAVVEGVGERSTAGVQELLQSERRSIKVPVLS